MAIIIRKRSAPPHENGQMLRLVEPSLPSPSLNIHLLRGYISWGERILISLRQRFPDDEFFFSGRNLLAHPPSREFVEKTNAVAVRYFEATGEESLNAESVCSEMTLILLDLINTKIDFYAEFGVKSHLELQHKERRLAELKKQALYAYFANGGCEMKRKIDEALVLCCVEEIYQKDKIAMDKYWEVHREDPWGPERHIEVEKEIYLLLRGAVAKALEQHDIVRTSRLNPTYGARLKKALTKTIQEVRRKLLEKIHETRHEKDKIRLQYQLFKSDFLAPSLIRWTLREALTPLIEETARYVQCLARQKAKTDQEEIAKCEKELQSMICCIDIEQLKQHFPDPYPQGMLEGITIVNSECRERCLKKLQGLRAKQDETYLAEAKAEWGFDVEEMSKILAEEATFHQSIIKALKRMEDFWKSQNTNPDQLDEDLKLDFSQMVDPVQYFKQVYANLDAEVLAILQKKVIVLL